MKRVLVALVVGAVLGAGVFLFLRKDAAELPPSSAAASAKAAASSGEPNELSSAFVSVAQPGLIVTVLRAGAAEPGARVELSRATRSPVTAELAWDRAGAEKTDPGGHASFPVRAGRYFVVATATDGVRAIEAVDVSWGSSSTLVTLALTTPRKFSGRVVDLATRKPLAGALVRAEPQAEPEGLEPTVPAASTTTDSLGRFTFELPDRRFRFEARAPAWLPNVAPEGLDDSELLIELTRGVQISGLVVDHAGQPVAEVTLRLAPGEVASLVSDREGRFSFTAAPGPTSLHALAPDGRQGLSRVIVGANEEKAQVRIVIGAGFELAGLVRDAQGPVLQADVRVLAEPESLEVAAFDTGADGRFAAKGLPAGRYSVRAQQGRGRRAAAVGLEVPGAGPIELALAGAGRVVGTVTDEEGHPLSGAKVTMHWPGGLNEVKRTARTADDGRYEFDDLLAAEAFVQATLADLVSEEAAAYVAPGATVELNLAVARQGRLAGTVTGRPIAALMVRSDRPGGEFLKVAPGNGHFEKLLPAGTYRIFAEIKGDGDHAFEFIESLTATVRAGELTTVALEVPFASDAGLPRAGYRLHTELGSGLSFENSPGGVRVDFLMSDCPAAKAGVRMGDLVVAIDDEPTRDALDAFARVRKPRDATAALEVTVRRDGQDLRLTLR